MRGEELGPEEAKLVEALRSIPPSPLRDRLAAFVTELADFVAQPSCAEMQADGAPCTSNYSNHATLAAYYERWNAHGYGCPA